MDDPLTVLSKNESGKRVNDVKDENAAQQKQQRPTLLQRKLPSEVTFTGSGCVGGQALIQVTDGDVILGLAVLFEKEGAVEVKQWRKKQSSNDPETRKVFDACVSNSLKLLGDLSEAIENADAGDRVAMFAELIANVPRNVVPCAADYADAGRADVIALVLDRGANGKLSEGFGVIRAIADEAKRFAVDWKLMKMKLEEVMNVALGKVPHVLRRLDSEIDRKAGRDLLQALSQVFPSSPASYSLQHVLSQLG